MGWKEPANRNAYNRKWRKANPEKVRAQRARKKALHGDEMRARKREYNRTAHAKALVKAYKKRNPEKVRKWLGDNRKRKRLRVLTMYGGKCACCSIDQKEFLAIDHTNGGGSADRKKYGGNGSGTNRYYMWLLEQKREGYRVLCHNCNASLGHYGYCPHAKTQLAAAD